MKPNVAIQRLLGSWTSPCYVMMVGAPGSGKSTFIKKFVANITDQFIVASTDDLIEEAAKKMGLTYSQAWDKVNQKTIKKQMDANIAAAIHARKTIFHDQTNMGSKKRSSQLAIVPESYFKICLDFTVDDKVLKERLDVRAKQTGKIIPPFVLKNMLNSYVAPSKNEGFDLILDIDNT